MFQWKVILVVSDGLNTQLSHKSKYHNDIDIVVVNVLGC